VFAERFPLFKVISVARFGDAGVIGKKVAVAKVPLIVAVVNGPGACGWKKPNSSVLPDVPRMKPSLESSR